MNERYNIGLNSNKNINWKWIAKKNF